LFAIARPGLIWALDFGQEGPRAIEDCDEGQGFRWLHLSLAHQGTIGGSIRSDRRISCAGSWSAGRVG
jgi:zinc transporter